MTEATREISSWSDRAKSVAGSRLQPLLEFLRRSDLVDLVSLFSLFMVLVFPFAHWLFQITVDLCLLFFLVQPKAIRSSWFWFVLAVAASFVVIQDWHAVDNHKYLLLYWLWILFLCRAVAEPQWQRRALLFNARFFLCFVFLASAGQKLASPTYRSGEMFEYYLYADSRFTAFDKLIGIDPSVPDAVQKRIALFRSPYSKPLNDELELPGNDRARAAGLILTWWDALLQLLIGLLLLFRFNATEKLGHILLLLFIFTTYLPAPIFGFGWILAIMGLTLAKEKFPRIAVAYMVSFVAVIVYQVPWREWVLGR
ncbi:MAG TPA: hypothetical protein VFA58_00420 [Chthoniobacterales bacterium]|nr:hypothetical protein [Chthoniobacterales bacterium]